MFKYMKKNKWFYILLIPGIIYFLIFHYMPMYGVIIAFKDFSFRKGIIGSDWVGFKKYITLFNSQYFWKVFKNSLILSLYRLFAGFPVPIVIALILNEVKILKFKKLVQTVIYLPHFVSWVVFAGIVKLLLSPVDGAVNIILTKLGSSPISFLQESKYFRTILVLSGVIKEAGWGTIVYLAAITAIDPQLYEAATIDGANRFQQVIKITLPSIANVIAILLVLNMGGIIRNGFEQVFLLYNPLVYEVADVIETYVYRTGIVEGKYSFTTAVGLFQSVIGMAMVLITNRISRAMGQTTLY